MGKDTIYRQDAIDAVADGLKRVFVENRDVAEILLKSVPSAQSGCADCIKHGGDWECDYNTCHKGMDTISRQEAIDDLRGKDPSQIWDTADIEVWVNALPSAQPETNCSEIPNNSDTIYRQDAIDALDKEYRCTDRSDDWDGLKTAMLIIENLPSVQPERKTAKWNFIGYNMFECTCCGTAYTTQQLNGLRNYNTDPYAPKFCPNCGADMRGEQDENR